MNAKLEQLNPTRSLSPLGRGDSAGGVYSCVLLAVLALAGCSERRDYPLARVDVEMLRFDFVRLYVNTLDEWQFAGSSSASISGGTELFNEIYKLSMKAFPDGEYLSQTRDSMRAPVPLVEGYTFHTTIGLDLIYKRNDSAN